MSKLYDEFLNKELGIDAKVIDTVNAAECELSDMFS